ncbi:MAG: hypothetical protein C0508_29780 [Cyanobacteria bacterium PR.023]|nr:hypothetical protein [Cyanobacteria bacterium PR.023]
MKRPELLYLIMLAVSGCALTPEYTWVKSGISYPEHEYAIADGLCLAEAYKAIPDGGSMSCSTIGSRISCDSRVGRKARAVREKIYDSCMMNKGWEKQLMQ